MEFDHLHSFRNTSNRHQARGLAVESPVRKWPEGKQRQRPRGLWRTGSGGPPTPAPHPPPAQAAMGRESVGGPCCLCLAFCSINRKLRMSGLGEGRAQSSGRKPSGPPERWSCVSYLGLYVGTTGELLKKATICPRLIK